MTFKEKIDNIVNVNALGITSVSGLEDYLGTGRQAINKFYNANREPGRKTLRKILSLPGLNLTWWETGSGDVFCNTNGQILTHEQKEPMISGNNTWTAEDNIRTLKEMLNGVRSDLAGVRAERDQYRKERDELKKEIEKLEQLVRERTASPDNIKK